MMKRAATHVIVFTCLSFLLAACGMSSATEKTAGQEQALDFTLNDLNGNSVSLSDFSGKKALLLDFTTTWCPHCVTIIPELKDIYNEYKDKDLQVLAIYVNESTANTEKFAQKHQIPYTVLVDEDGSIGNKYEIRGVPTIIVVGKDGMIKDRGHRISRDVIESAVK
ncbi:MAG: TlpA disulfide reductase family protein [Candidatus Omnitrophota bacterium]